MANSSSARHAFIVEKDALIRQLHSEIQELRSKSQNYDYLQKQYSDLEQAYERDARTSTTKT